MRYFPPHHTTADAVAVVVAAGARWSRHITRHNGYNTATIPVSCFSLLRCCAVSLMQLLLSCALCAVWVWVWGFLNTGSAEDGAQKCGTKCQMRVIKRCFSCRQDTGLLEDFIVTRREICKKRSSCQFGGRTWHSVHITRHNTLHH